MKLPFLYDPAQVVLGREDSRRTTPDRRQACHTGTLAESRSSSDDKPPQNSPLSVANRNRFAESRSEHKECLGAAFSVFLGCISHPRFPRTLNIQVCRTE